MTLAQTLQKSVRFLGTLGRQPQLIQLQAPPPFDVVLRDIDSLFKVTRVANALDILEEFNFSSN